MTEEEWAALNKSVDAVSASADRLGDALSELGETLSRVPSGKHTADGVTVIAEHRRFIWRSRWRAFWQSILP